jgi:putative ABC transport system permease protein
MVKLIWGAFVLSFDNIRSRFFHTVLSVLGIVIGVAALVSILSLIDGMEKFAKEQISKTTPLNVITIASKTHRVVNNISIRKDSFNILTYKQFEELGKSLLHVSKRVMSVSFSAEVALLEDSILVGAKVTALSLLDTAHIKIQKGKTITEQEIQQQQSLALVNLYFVELLKEKNSTDVLGKQISIKNKNFTIAGILEKSDSENPEIIIPVSTLTYAELKEYVPTYSVKAENVNEIKLVKAQITDWLAKHFGQDDFAINTNDFRIDQAEKGFLLFRIIMGLIVGISVVVGGIGVMNVLLISVTERTREIGIRKAVGAKRTAILYQFLTESITISVFGSLVGVIFGVVFTMIAVPIVKAVTKIPFQAEYTLNTLFVISAVAILVGVVFGTYPALRASRLDPVEAIRKE